MADSDPPPASTKPTQQKRKYKWKPSRKMQSRMDVKNEIERLMAGSPTSSPSTTSVAQNVNSAPNNGPAGFHSLDSTTLARIFGYLSLEPLEIDLDFGMTELDVECPSMPLGREERSRRYHATKKRYQFFVRLRSVNAQFKWFFDSSRWASDFQALRPGVCMRLMPKPPREYPEEEISDNLVLVYLYHTMGEKIPCQVVHLSHLAEAIRPCALKRHLTIGNIEFNQMFVDALKSLDLSLVTEVYFNNAFRLDTSKIDCSITDIINLFPSLEFIEFVSPTEELFEQMKQLNIFEFDREDSTYGHADTLVAHVRRNNNWRENRKKRKKMSARNIARRRRAPPAAPAPAPAAFPGAGAVLGFGGFGQPAAAAAQVQGAQNANDFLGGGIGDLWGGGGVANAAANDNGVAAAVDRFGAMNLGRGGDANAAAAADHVMNYRPDKDGDASDADDGGGEW